VLPNRQIRIDQGDLSRDQKLLLENYAESLGTGLWMLDEARHASSLSTSGQL